ncbi:MAG: hypothetical protein KME12_18045 [Trichocoleus desertorum ATA4-8-CV12]|nr:hypothetical protein [Trichocoleus desertorum ATA4-8-CV12]
MSATVTRQAATVTRREALGMAQTNPEWRDMGDRYWRCSPCSSRYRDNMSTRWN